MQTPSC